MKPDYKRKCPVCGRTVTGMTRLDLRWQFKLHMEEHQKTLDDYK